MTQPAATIPPYFTDAPTSAPFGTFPFPKLQEEYDALSTAQRHALENAAISTYHLSASGKHVLSTPGPGWPGGLNSTELVGLSVFSGGTPIAGGPLAGAVDTIASITDGLAKGAAWLSNRHNWTRVLYFTLGVGLVWSGSVILFRRTLATGRTLRVVGK